MLEPALPSTIIYICNQSNKYINFTIRYTLSNVSSG